MKDYISSCYLQRIILYSILINKAIRTTRLCMRFWISKPLNQYTLKVINNWHKIYSQMISNCKLLFIFFKDVFLEKAFFKHNSLTVIHRNQWVKNMSCLSVFCRKKKTGAFQTYFEHVFNYHHWLQFMI